MTTLIKTVPVSELPAGWQAELGLSDRDMVRVEIQEVAPRVEPDVPSKALQRLRGIRPAPARINSTELIRSERDRIDGRNP
jgi:hypothetical protein